MLIRTRITLAALAVAVVIAGTLGVAGLAGQQAAEARFVEASVSGKRVLLDQLVARHASEMRAAIRAVTRDSVALKALRAGDRKTLLEQVDTTHNTLSSDGTIDRLQVFDPDGRYLASAPQRFEGVTAKALVGQAAAEASTVFGLTRDEDGALQAAFAFPLYVRGKLKGIAVYSRDLQRIVDDFQANDGTDVFVRATDERRRYAAAGNRLGEPGKALLETPPGTLSVVDAGDRYLAVTALDVAETGGQALGALLTVEDQTDSYRQQAAATYTSIALVVLTLAAAAVGLFWYVRRAFRPIEGTIDAMTAIADGELTCTLAGHGGSDDETGRLSRALCGMVEQLRELVSDITGSAERLTNESRDLMRLSDESSGSIARQSEETDQLATAINEMTATVQEVARNALAAAEATTEASEKAGHGQVMVQETIDSITRLAADVERAGGVIARLRAESENIGSVLEVIRAVSEQTNLLALNAAIEAARAGEHGRGFAVVADEVRTLASRTQASTEEIQSMITRLQVEAGEAVEVIAASQSSSTATVEQATRAGEALTAITESVALSNSMNNQIAGAADEQHTVAEMINSSVTHIAQLAEASSERTAETARSSEALAELSERLGTLIHRFRL